MYGTIIFAINRFQIYSSPPHVEALIVTTVVCVERGGQSLSHERHDLRHDAAQTRVVDLPLGEQRVVTVVPLAASQRRVQGREEALVESRKFLARLELRQK